MEFTCRNCNRNLTDVYQSYSQHVENAVGQSREEQITSGMNLFEKFGIPICCRMHLVTRVTSDRQEPREASQLPSGISSLIRRRKDRTLSYVDVNIREIRPKHNIVSDDFIEEELLRSEEEERETTAPSDITGGIVSTQEIDNYLKGITIPRTTATAPAERKFPVRRPRIPGGIIEIGSQTDRPRKCSERA